MKARITVSDFHVFGSGSSCVILQAWIGKKWTRVKGNPASVEQSSNGFVGVKDAIVELYPKTRVKYIRSFYPGGTRTYEGTWQGLVEQKEFPLVRKMR